MTDFNPAEMPLTRRQLIEASAGTGKTYTITNLVLRLLLGRDEHWPEPMAINQVLVLTFTIAATDELKYRIARRIRQARQAFREASDDPFLQWLVNGSTDPVRDCRLLTAASQLMDEACIFTIHGFCARVLGEQAFESGAMFNQDLNAERDTLLLSACEDTFRTEILTREPAERDIALALWPSPAQLAAQLSPLLFRGELVRYPAVADIDAGSLTELALKAKRFWVDEHLGSILAGAGLNRARKVFKSLEQMTAFCELTSPDIGSELWAIYSRSSVEKAFTKGHKIPDLPFFDWAEKLSAAPAALQAALYHQVMDSVERRMRACKQDFHKMTLDDLLTNLAAAVTRPGSALPARIAVRWPVAMIDEFQDTDTIQGSIFNQVYSLHEHEQDRTLLMIGDPKQAIYNFRGADIYSYINTRRQASGIHTLSVNWRSSPALVKATNWLFDQPAIFDSDDIPFQPVAAAVPNAGMRLTINGDEVTPYQLFMLDESGGPVGVQLARDRAMAWAAEQTVSLLTGNARTEDGPVEAGQIAFLVRSRTDAVAARNALAERGVQSVYLTLESVLLQDTAADLRLILEAVLEPKSDRAIRAALGSRLMQSTAADIEALNHEIQAQQDLLNEFQEYHRIWLDRGVAPMLNTLMRQRALASKWLKQQDGERQLTNFRHLTEILQQQEMIAPGMYRLLKWFSQEQLDAERFSSEAQQLRLESDENLVKIVTMHAAKGLEYDIIMIPMPVFSARHSKGPLLFHEEQQGSFVAAVELGEDADHKRLAAREEKAEEMRLIYVALTRARYRCYLGVPRTGDFPVSALARLLRVSNIDKDASLPAALAGKLDPGLFEQVDGNHCGRTPFLVEPASIDPANRPGRPVVRDRWRIHSYSSVASRLGSHGSVSVSGYGDDDRAEETAMGSPVQSRFSFPRGARVGVVLHSLLELVDFRAPDTFELACRNALARLGLDDTWLPVLQAWLQDILATPLGPCSLGEIARVNRVDEMEFHFPITAATGLSHFLLEAGYLADDPADLGQLKGFMTGMIDLVFRVKDRYYIVDYKSNHLGNQQSDYQDAAMAQAMANNQYHLQYLIYTVALHRLLQRRLPHYNYEEHCGGVRYLFLRGMNGTSTDGVFSARPEFAVVERFDALLNVDSPAGFRT